MSWIETSLMRLERRLRALFEGEGASDGMPPRLRRQLERSLEKALREFIKIELAGNNSRDTAVATPDQYTIVMPIEPAQYLLSHPGEIDRLARLAENLAGASHLAMAATPMLRIVPDPNMQEPQAYCEHSQDRGRDFLTTELADLPPGAQATAENHIPNAFLIVNGLSTYQLSQPVVNIGRDPANQLVLDDASVSRKHAQLRLISGRYVIFDLNSLSGTYVNGGIISSRMLNPGDVIHLAGVPLVYGQESGPVLGSTQQLPASAQPPEIL